MSKFPIRAISLAAALAAAAAGFAQPPSAPPSAAVVGVGGFSHIVENVDRSLKFYRDVLGLTLIAPPRPFDSTPWIMQMGNTPGAQSRPALLRIPGSALGVELIDYRHIDRKAAHPRFQDPGAASLVLTVRDLDAVMAKAKAAGIRVMSKGGVPADIGNGARVVFLQDPDGFFLELSERKPAPTATAPKSSNVIGGNFELIVADLDKAMQFYHNLLGFEFKNTTKFDGSKLLMDTAGTPGAQFRRTVATIPGTSVSMAMLEFKDIDRKPLHTRVQDPGTAILQVRVRDTDAVTKALAAAGATVISAGGKPVDAGPGRRFALVRDPNNLFLELFQGPPAAGNK
jgi:catechol 2,3-dioxygenase-like lactoylglutathione lyase family enzyme